MPQPRKAFTSKELTSIEKRYKKGETLTEIAEDFECSPSTIRNRLLEREVAMRPRGKRTAA